MKLEAFLVNSFTGNDAEGNPAGVVITEQSLEPFLMQKIATEIGFSETAFVSPVPKQKQASLYEKQKKWLSRFLPQEEDEYTIRWFTPVLEVPLCGHATLAAAAVIFQQHPEKGAISFLSPSGKLKVFRQAQLLILDFPADTFSPCEPPSGIVTALGIEKYVSCQLGKLTKYLLLHLQNENQVAQIAPNYPLLKAIKLPELNGICVTSVSDSDSYDFVSRFFVPWEGIIEDPVTGSAHTLLGPYWHGVFGKRKMTARQISSRGGVLYLQINDNRRINIGGYAETFGKISL